MINLKWIHFCYILNMKGYGCQWIWKMKVISRGQSTTPKVLGKKHCKIKQKHLKCQTKSDCSAWNKKLFTESRVCGFISKDVIHLEQLLFCLAFVFVIVCLGDCIYRVLLSPDAIKLRRTLYIYNHSNNTVKLIWTSITVSTAH